MEKILSKGKIPRDHNIIAAATDVKNASLKRGVNITFGIILFILGSFSLLIILTTLSHILTEPFDGASVGMIFLFLLGCFLALFLFIFAFSSFSTTSKWFLILYTDRLFYKYLTDTIPRDTAYQEIEIPLGNIDKCFILRKFEEGIPGRRMKPSSYTMSTHFQYIEDGEVQFISLYQNDGYEGLNQVLNHLATIKKTPIYFAKSHQRAFQLLDDLESLKSAEEVTFSGDLKDYDKGSISARLH